MAAIDPTIRLLDDELKTRIIGGYRYVNESIKNVHQTWSVSTPCAPIRRHVDMGMLSLDVARRIEVSLVSLEYYA